MPADFGRVKEIFLAAVEKADPPEREAYLREACGDDEELRRQAEALLRHHEMTGSILESPFAHPSALTESRASGRPLTGEAAAPPEAEGGRVGPYRLVQMLGEGGMGVVWQAEQTEPLKRRVALKVIKPGMDSAHVVRRFEAERQALALMDHPNIARVFDAATTAEGRPYFVMELVRGVPITKYCDELHLTVRERLELFVPVCRAIQHAHSKGIIHRDIKPSNVLVSMQDGKPVPKVIDFGVAKALHQPLTDASLHTAIGQLVGTLEYASPEQAELSALDVDTRSDTYSLGVLLYELLTGTTPIDRKRLRQAYVEIVRLIREEEPKPPSSRLTESAEALAAAAELRRTEPRRLQKAVRGELDWIVLKCLEKDRTRRYETVDGLARDVERHLADEPVEASRPGVGYRLGKFLRRHRAGVLTAAAFVLLLVAATAVSVWQAMRATAERDEKEEARREAVESEERAVEAAAAERKAKELAGRRLGQIEKANEVLASLFGDFNPQTQGLGDPIRGLLCRRLEQAAKDLDALVIDDPLTLARIQGTLGNTLFMLSGDRPGIALMVKARDTLQVGLGSAHLDTLHVSNNLGMAYVYTNQWDKAIPLLTQTFEKSKAEFGLDHPLTLSVMSNLGRGYQDSGKFDKALPLREALLARLKAKQGIDNPDTKTAMFDLARVYERTGDLNKAESLYKEKIARAEVKLGIDHFETLMDMTTLATIFMNARQYNKAVPLFEVTLKRRRTKLGPGHQLTLQDMWWLASAYWGLEKLDTSLPLYEELIMRMNAGNLNEQLRKSAIRILVVGYLAKGQHDKAIPLLPEALEIWKTELEGVRANNGRTSPHTALHLSTMGFYLLLQRKYTEAESMLRECLAICEKSQPELWFTFDTRSRLGGALLGQKKFAEAEPLLVAGYEGMKGREARIPFYAKIYLTEALERLVELYEKTGAKDKAAAYRKELEAARAAAKKKPAP